MQRVMSRIVTINLVVVFSKMFYIERIMSFDCLVCQRSCMSVIYLIVKHIILDFIID